MPPRPGPSPNSGEEAARARSALLDARGVSGRWRRPRKAPRMDSQANMPHANSPSGEPVEKSKGFLVIQEPEVSNQVSAL